ncbi:methylglyoxal synthase [Pleurocapsales cyanobacterium LEGE 06147]|nr:methylglyoxal synthase [Pleurocapsales cyanobacterium LEGE 06147]
MASTVALIAHDTKKDDIVALVQKYSHTLSRYYLIATGTTGKRLQEGTELEVECLFSGSEGGDVQIAARVVTGEVAAVIFLIDPLYAQPHEPDIRALLRVCEVHNVPLATNLATADAVIKTLAKARIGYLIFNPIAGQSNPDQDLALIRQILEPQIQLKIIFTKPDMNPADRAREAIARIQSAELKNTDTDFIIASGGDGTVSAVASATIRTGIPLGVIPRGTANAFAVALGIPTDLRGACETILAGNTRVVDAARCNDLPMILLAGIGFEAGMVDRADRELKNRLGTLAYILAGFQQFTEQELFEATLEIDGKAKDIESSAITIANAAPPTSVLAQGFGRTIPDDGQLEVTIATSQTKLQGLNALASLFASAIVKNPTNREDILSLRAQRIKVITNPPQKIVVDGEIVGTTPAEFECIPKGLTVLAPLASVLSEQSNLTSEN